MILYLLWKFDKMLLDLPKEATAFTCYINLNAVDVTYLYNIIFPGTGGFFRYYCYISYISYISITYINSINFCFTQTWVLPSLWIIPIAEIWLLINLCHQLSPYHLNSFLISCPFCWNRNLLLLAPYTTVMQE